MINQLLGQFIKIVKLSKTEWSSMRNTIKLSNNAEKVSTPGEARYGALPVVKKANQKVTTSPMSCKGARKR